LASARAQRRLAAILAADVAGYSRLIGADEEGTLAPLKALRSALLDPSIRRHQGRIFKTTGDGVMAEFASVIDAVLCAVDVQRAMVASNAGIPAEQRIAFWIGINLGDVIVDADDIYGDGVNVAARLEGLAKVGGVCASDKVRTEIAGKLDMAFEFGGEQQLKNIAQPVRVYHWRPDPAAAGRPAANGRRPLRPDASRR
jgi:adenylate cyclase